VAALLGICQTCLAVLVLVTGVRAVRAVRRARTLEERDAAEVGALRPALHAVALFVVAVLSGPLLVAVLRSYVPQWQGVMCVAGVMRIGTGTDGTARHLPALLAALHVTKPLLLLLGGAWIVSHAIERRASGRPGVLGPALLTLAGLVALADAALELTYLGIPKREEYLASGCCFTAPVALRGEGTSWLESWGVSLGGAVSQGALAAAMLVLLAGLWPRVRSPGGAAPGSAAAWIGLLAVGSVATVLAQHVVVAVASPAVHGVASHRCGWCVLERTALGGPAITAFVGAVGAILLGAAAAWLERRDGGVGCLTSRLLARVAAGCLLISAGLAALA
jgi:hypothetical protein